jgi:hypothetical protein
MIPRLAALVLLTFACACSSRPAEVAVAPPVLIPDQPAAPPASVAAPAPAATTPPPAPFEGRCPAGDHDPTAWRAVDPARVTEEELHALNGARCEWDVSLGGAGSVARESQRPAPVITAALPLPTQWGGPRRFLQRPAGYLVGFNRGEWGGALLWYGNDSKLRKSLIDDNVVEIIPAGGALVAFVGLAHLGMDEGHAVEILETPKSFAVGRSVDVGSAPCAAAREGSGSFLVVTFKGLSRVSADFKATKLLESRWGILYPTSMVIAKNGTVTIGMRGGVARLTPSAGGYEERWLLSPVEQP